MILDTHALENKRKIIAFIGGLDLCDGRYDTPEHRLYRDLDTVYLNDCYNPMFPVSGYYPITITTWLIFACLLSLFPFFLWWAAVEATLK